jgi:hypothetical protein
MIAALDQLDGDAEAEEGGDEEPELGWAEGEVRWGRYSSGVDGGEPSLGWTSTINQLTPTWQGATELAAVVLALVVLFEVDGCRVADAMPIGGLSRGPPERRFPSIMLGLEVVIASTRPVRLIEAGVAHLCLLRPERGAVDHGPAHGHALAADAWL